MKPCCWQQMCLLCFPAAPANAGQAKLQPNQEYTEHDHGGA